VLIRAGKHHVKRLVDAAEGRMSSPVDLTWTTTANSANMAVLHINFNCMTQLHQNLLDRLLMMPQRNLTLRSWTAQLML